jgi:hypothetical protein
MTEQTDFTHLTRDSTENDTSDNDDPEGDASTTPGGADSGGSNSEVDTLVDPAVESWIAEREDREEDYGYFHLFVVAKSDLTGVERQLRYEEELDFRVSEDDTSRQYGGRWGKGGVRVAEARDRLIDWKLSELATPYHPDLRTASAGNLRIFVADPARDFLREQDVEIDALAETLNHLHEHEPTDEQLATRREYIETREAVTGGSAPLKQRVRAIETTVRARFGFSRRYSGEVPDPHPDYQNLDPTALKRELESARDELEQTEQRKDGLRQEIADDEARWVEEMHEELFD